jgi:phospholipid N-methyltransferase
MKHNSELIFFSKWFASPLRVASVTPSSAPLARAMASALPAGDGTVVELGGGTGPITHALLEAGVRSDQLVVIERDAQFCNHLVRRFPGVVVRHGDALDLVALMEDLGVNTPVCAVVSGLPLLSMSSAAQEQLLQQALRLTRGTGPLIQFSYGLASPLRKSVVQRLALVARCVAQVWRNVPPAKVWTYECPAPYPASRQTQGGVSP